MTKSAVDKPLKRYSGIDDSWIGKTVHFLSEKELAAIILPEGVGAAGQVIFAANFGGKEAVIVSYMNEIHLPYPILVKFPDGETERTNINEWVEEDRPIIQEEEEL